MQERIGDPLFCGTRYTVTLSRKMLLPLPSKMGEGAVFCIYRYKERVERFSARAKKIQRQKEEEKEAWTRSSLEERLQATNGSRRTRVLTLEEVQEEVREVASWPAGQIGRIKHVKPFGLIDVSGNSYGYKAVSTIAVVARVPRGVVVDIYQAGARGGLPAGEGLSQAATGPNPTPHVRRRVLNEWAPDTQRLRYSLAAAKKLGDT
jgi:hypothetical protein